jgi:hypothetical protein
MINAKLAKLIVYKANSLVRTLNVLQTKHFAQRL